MFKGCAVVAETLGMALDRGIDQTDAIDALKPLMKTVLDEGYTKLTTTEEKKQAQTVSTNNVNEAILSKLPQGDLRDSVGRALQSWGDAIPLQLKQFMVAKLAERPIDAERAADLMKLVTAMCDRH